MVFYNENDIRYLVKVAYRKLLHEIMLKEEKTVEETVKSLVFCPLGSVSESGTFLSNYFRKENNLSVLQVVCQNCGKSFGIALLGTCDEKEMAASSQSDLALQVQDGPDAICYDDVIDAHNFFKNLDENWEQYIPEDLRKTL